MIRFLSQPSANIDFEPDAYVHIENHLVNRDTIGQKIICTRNINFVSISRVIFVKNNILYFLLICNFFKIISSSIIIPPQTFYMQHDGNARR